jgi:hypothetical protein
MPEVDRAKMLRVLPERGMGWHLLEEEEPVELRLTHAPRPPKLYAYRELGQRIYLEDWHPDRDGGDAFELLVAMRKKPKEVFWRFADWLHKAIGDQGIIETITRAPIAQAACEALLQEGE